jgi:hypothetical protein
LLSARALSAINLASSAIRSSDASVCPAIDYGFTT